MLLPPAITVRSPRYRFGSTISVGMKSATCSIPDRRTALSSRVLILQGTSAFSSVTAFKVGALRPAFPTFVLYIEKGSALQEWLARDNSRKPSPGRKGLDPSPIQVPHRERPTLPQPKMRARALQCPRSPLAA